MKKICFITTVPSTLEAFILPLAKFLIKETDWNVTLISSYNENFEKIIPSNIRYIPVEMKRGISLNGISSFFKLLKIFKREKFDLIQYSTPNASLYASLAGKLARIPVRLYCQWGMVYVGMRGIKRKIFKLEEKFVCKLSTWIEPDSLSNLNFAHNEKLYSKSKGSVIGHGSACGITFEKFDISKKSEYRFKKRNEFNMNEDNFVYGFVGRITKDKGINELLESFKKILNYNNKNILLVVGPNDNIDTLDKELYQWSLKCENVIYAGSTKKVEEYLAAMDCYILPSYREGFGMGTIEAEAMGVPVIVTNIPGPIDAMIPEITGKIVEKQNAISLESAMKEMIDMPLIKRQQMGQEAFNFVVENFDQNKLFSLILKDRQVLLGEKNNE